MRSAHRCASAALIVFVVAGVIAAGAQTVRVPDQHAAMRWHDVSIDDYGRHLIALESLVDACARGRDVKSCDPMLVGPDDRITITVGAKTELRLIRYGWLRVLLSKAEDPDEKATKPATGKDANKRDRITMTDRPPTSQLLKEAKTRLERDLAQSHEPTAPVPNHVQEEAAMREVLAGKDFRNLQESTVRDSILEKVGMWLNRLFASAANLTSHSAWVGRALVWGFILSVCVVLGYSLLRLERRWRVRLTPEDDQRPAAGAASSRDWQLWLEDARKAAASGAWREAIHFLYWAAISRLESRRLWPADRARTPREYLALIAEEDPRRPGLSQLTGTFERFWYGGRAAGESDYKTAESLATTLMSGGAPGEGGGR